EVDGHEIFTPVVRGGASDFLAGLPHFDARLGQSIPGGIADLAVEQRFEPRRHDHRSPHEFSVMSTKRRIPSRLAGIVEIPEANQVRFIACKLLEAVLADLRLGSRHPPDADLIHLTVEILVFGRKILPGAAPEEAVLAALDRGETPRVFL